jgi:hypothetical protein
MLSANAWGCAGYGVIRLGYRHTNEILLSPLSW